MEEFPQEQQEKKQFGLDVTFDQLAEALPDFKKMIGFDQKSDYHTLTLDVHTKELVAALENDPFILSLDPKLQKLIRLAGLMHDLGKTTDIGKKGESGRQIHPQDPEKRRYANHESFSAKMSRRILTENFDLKPEELEFVVKLVRMHGDIMQIMNHFIGIKKDEKSKRKKSPKTSKYDLPEGKDLTYYAERMEHADMLPVDLSIKDKFNILFAFGRADKGANYNEETRERMENSSYENERSKIKDVVEKCKVQIAAISELGKALPAIVDAVEGMQAGDNARPKVVFHNGEYVYDKNVKVVIPEQLGKVQSLDENQKKRLVKSFINFQRYLAQDELGAIKMASHGLLRKNMKLSDEQMVDFLKAVGLTDEQVEVVIAK
ncbi:hypothetical protein COT97_04235 [Candidatus Falkowbacteria bacterium CG10_big_fil_rev_8_21_14_0_10_39_11]|uniref:HD domain-containing protein n=1 Tax=Candidatus Falkowbacteria bacterium CG10_big_fil_rev_8_21_14_0_10_39_11 TaxID=1974565 RepID=A0A2H0V490_9BACT|nr:MAG: hypothetical protein COT97_04235 [Candidatus Falkowbacteria bacterium CG10_big_fil_rev_8_21_14_0_10_39_11]